ncbi:hypothetical protein C1646_815643 [Rhizophagus diaphanus]|nr:hypothetical protein C1646_815643 [Rhizophagus diaphanus] [Rhizophagus sp. MUCL 43196]
MEDTVIEIPALPPLSQEDNSILDIDSKKEIYSDDVNSIGNFNSEETLPEKNPARPHNGKQIDKIIISQEDNSILDIESNKEVYGDDVTYSEKDKLIVNSNSEVTLQGDNSIVDSNNEEVLKNFVVTYSKEDNSIHGWSINIETNGQRHQQPDVYFKLDDLNRDEEMGIDIDLKSFVLYKKILLFYYRYNKNKSEYKIENKIDYENNYYLIDLNGDKGRSLQLKHAEGLYVKRHSIGFLPNGDIILVSLNDKFKDYKIYKYLKPTTNTTSWENYKIYDIEILEGLIKHNTNCFVYQTKLFLFNGCRMYQWNLNNLDKLNRINFEKQYFLSDYTSDNSIRSFSIVINKCQTLLALKIKKYHDKINIFSMENGMWISRLNDIYYHHTPIEFVTLKNGSEVLLIVKDSNNKSRFLDPFNASNVIDIDNINTDKNIVTKSDKKISIVDNNVSITNGNKFEKILNTVYIYNKPIFTTIRNMLKDISENDKEGFKFPDNNKIELEYGNYFQIILEKNSNQDVYIKVFEKSQNNNKWEEIGNKKCYHYTDLISYKQLDNQELVLIIRKGIYIYTIAKDEPFRKLRLRYFWMNKEWDEYIETLTYGKTTKNNEFKSLINNILKNEFNDSKLSLPSPNFITMLEKIGSPKYEDLFLDIINDPAEFSKFRLEIQDMLKKAIDKGNNFVIKSIVDKINNPLEFLEKAIEKGHYFTIKSIVDKTIELIKSNDYLNYNYMTMISLISLNLTKLCEHYPNLAMKYISCTSILLDPDCSSISCSINPSLIYTYSKNIYIKPSYNKSLLKEKSEEKKKEENYQIISFIVPFPYICNSTKYDNNWNELIYKRTSVLFCNVDTNDYYQLWNFLAIIDFKWEHFGRIYYYLIWFFYTIFYLCFTFAATLEQNFISDFNRGILFIFSIIFGFIHLTFEIQQFLYLRKTIYLKDIWNLFDLGAYSLPIITSICWFIVEEPPLWITAISIILLNFKFLLFFRVLQYFGIYFIIMIGVGRKIIPFLVILLFIILGFAHAFFILLRSTNENDLAVKYNSFNSDGTISSNATLIQSIDSNTNMFNYFPTSLLAMYLLLIGDSGSLSPWTYRESHTMTFLLFLFTFFTVIYLMNLFIGLLNMAIEKYDNYEEFLLQKAKVIMEIELFYMLPWHKKKKEWFPDWIHYSIPANEVRKFIIAIDKNKTGFKFDPPFISKKLRGLVDVEDVEDKDRQEEEKHQAQIKNMERKLEDMHKLLKDLKNFKNADDNKTNIING